MCIPIVFVVANIVVDFEAIVVEGRGKEWKRGSGQTKKPTPFDSFVAPSLHNSHITFNTKCLHSYIHKQCRIRTKLMSHIQRLFFIVGDEKE
jgi:hypothetical protein